MTEKRIRIRLSPVERAAKSVNDAMRHASTGLMQHAGVVDEQAAQRIVLAIKAGVVPGLKMEIPQP